MATSYHLLATLQSEAACNTLVTALLTKGYAVEALSGDKQVVWKGEVSALLAVKVSGDVKLDKNELHISLAEHAKAVLKERSCCWYSLVVTQVPVYQGSTMVLPTTWSPSNITLPSDKGPFTKEKPDAPVTQLDKAGDIGEEP